MSTKSPVTADRLRQIINEELAGLVEFRHDLHAHPELLYKETRTSQRVRDELTGAGITFVGDLAGGTGILGFLPGSDESRTVALRADMDALPIIEETGLPYASTHPGVMHACGHDGHTTVCLGAAKVLKRIADETGLPRPVKFVFQPAEEGGGGGEKMVEDGVLGSELLGPAVFQMFGLHCWPILELGKIATRPGPLLAATDLFTIRVRGTMSHAAYPHYSHDPIVAVAELIGALQSIVSRNVDPIDSAVVSITKIHGGEAFNVIPEMVEIAGTSRTLSEEMRTYVRERLFEISDHVAKAHRCEAEIEWHVGYPVTNNHPDAVDVFFQHARAAVGDDRTQTWPTPTMGGEDFSYYAQEVPSCFFLLGQQRGPDEPYPNVHTPQFDFNDDSIALGVEMFCRIALDLGDSAPGSTGG